MNIIPLLILLKAFIPTSAHASPRVEHYFVDEDIRNISDNPSLPENISEEMFHAIIKAVEGTYQPIASQQGEKLIIGGFWNDSTVNANCQRQVGKIIVTVYGGIARRPELTPDGFALVLCHEVAHGYGGAPRKRIGWKMSAEGQADYAGAKECLRRVIPALPPQTPESNPSNDEVCNHYRNGGVPSCQRELAAAASVGALLGFIKSEPTPTFETPDPTRVSRTLDSYPATIQCRLDTYFNAIRNLERPLCWYRP